MKRIGLFGVICLIASLAMAQETVFITGFEDTEDIVGEWSWTGGSFLDSFVDYPTDVKPVEGEAVLVVIYDNGGSEWQHSTLNFGIPPVDLTGMREIHMSVYFTPDSTGELRVRLDLPGGNILGFADVPSAGEWHELVWKIDRLSSQSRVSDIGFMQGFIVPTPGDAAGEVWIDNIYAVKPASIPDIEEILLYGFNEADAVTGEPAGWTSADGVAPELAGDQVEPLEGDNALMFFGGSGYLQNIRTVNALSDFDRWDEVVEILFDVRASGSVPGGWLQSRIRVRSGIGDNEETVVEDASKEIGYADAVDDWKTLLYEVDMTNHLDNIHDPNGWLEIRIDTNHDASAEGFPIFVDNFRVSVPAGGPVNVSEWSVY